MFDINDEYRAASRYGLCYVCANSRADDDEICEKADYECSQCAAVCLCKGCLTNENFTWRGSCKTVWRDPVNDPPKGFQPVIVCREKAKGQYIVEQGLKDVGDWWKVYGTRTKKVVGWMPFPKPMKMVRK